MPPKKNNKTAHVLNLLTTNEEDAKETNADPAPLEKAKEKPAAKPSSKIEIQTAESDPVSDILRDELEKNFEEETKDIATVGEELLKASSRNIAEGKEDMADDTNNTLPTSEDSEYITINIVEDIVKSRAKEFMKKMGGCDCYRCVNDVVALALNELPPKYTVTHKGMLFAKITSYENQYSADISKALTKACMLVLDAPRH